MAGEETRREDELDRLIALATAKWRIWLLEHPDIDNETNEAGDVLFGSIIPALIPAERDAILALCADDRIWGDDHEADHFPNLVRAVVYDAVVDDVRGEVFHNIVRRATAQFASWLADHPNVDPFRSNDNDAGDASYAICEAAVPADRAAQLAVCTDDRVWDRQIDNSYKSLADAIPTQILTTIADHLKPTMLRRDQATVFVDGMLDFAAMRWQGWVSRHPDADLGAGTEEITRELHDAYREIENELVPENAHQLRLYLGDERVRARHEEPEARDGEDSTEAAVRWALGDLIWEHCAKTGPETGDERSIKSGGA